MFCFWHLRIFLSYFSSYFVFKSEAIKRAGCLYRLKIWNKIVDKFAPATTPTRRAKLQRSKTNKE
jgi:hypothetical protein